MISMHHRILLTWARSEDDNMWQEEVHGTIMAIQYQYA